MGGLELRGDLEEMVAAKFARPAVARLLDEAAEQVRRRAPEAKVWVTARDEKVRPTHVQADSQTIPDNLRYRVPHPTLADELARHPGDPNLSPANRQNCRCTSAALPGAIAATVAKGPVLVTGTTVRGEVSATFHRVVESEYPSQGDSGGGWMRAALRATAATTRARPGRV